MWNRKLIFNYKIQYGRQFLKEILQTVLTKKQTNKQCHIWLKIRRVDNTGTDASHSHHRRADCNAITDHRHGIILSLSLLS